MVLDDHEVADVIGPEIPRVKCTCIDASQLDSKDHDGDLKGEPKKTSPPKI